jgi:hypothetical protein
MNKHKAGRKTYLDSSMGLAMPYGIGAGQAPSQRTQRYKFYSKKQSIVSEFIILYRNFGLTTTKNCKRGAKIRIFSAGISGYSRKLGRATVVF